MAKILLTGGSGFIAAHILESLLSRGHSVVTTVRSQSKADQIKKIHPNVSADKLGFAIVEDMSQPNAFDKAVISDPPFDVVVHAASPFHHDINDVMKDMIDPAVKGTTGILKAVKQYAPTVKRVVVTSSFAAMINTDKPKTEKYSESDWNPVTEDQVSASNGYRASKTLAEQAAWKFVKEEKPNFSLVVLNPTLVLGPISPYLIPTLEAVNTSNKRIRDMITGAAKEKCPPTNSSFWIDVRDLALAHSLAAEKSDAEVGNQRFFTTAGPFCNKQIVEIIGDAFEKYKSGLPEGEALKSGDWMENANYGLDTSRSRNVLGVNYRGMKESVIDTVHSLQQIGA